MPERLTWSVEEASQILGVGRQLGYELARTGQIPVIRLGRRLLVPRGQLQAMLENVSIPADAPTDHGTDRSR